MNINRFIYFCLVWSQRVQSQSCLWVCCIYCTTVILLNVFVNTFFLCAIFVSGLEGTRIKKEKKQTKNKLKTSPKNIYLQSVLLWYFSSKKILHGELLIYIFLYFYAKLFFPFSIRGRDIPRHICEGGWLLGGVKWEASAGAGNLFIQDHNIFSFYSPSTKILFTNPGKWGSQVSFTNPYSRVKQTSVQGCLHHLSALGDCTLWASLSSSVKWSF